jgi:hypothetical protein
LPPQPVQVADTQRQRCLPLGDPVEQHTARARWVLVEQFPQQGLFNDAKLSPGTKGWRCIVTWAMLAQGEVHVFILLEHESFQG